MSAIQRFAPAYGTNQVLTANASSQTASIRPGNKQLQIVNTGSNKGYFVAFNSQGGTVTRAATTADCPVAPGLASVVTIGEDFDKVSYISATGTTFEIMTGEGF